MRYQFRCNFGSDRSSNQPLLLTRSGGFLSLTILLPPKKLTATDSWVWSNAHLLLETLRQQGETLSKVSNSAPPKSLSERCNSYRQTWKLRVCVPPYKIKNLALLRSQIFYFRCILEIARTEFRPRHAERGSGAAGQK